MRALLHYGVPAASEHHSVAGSVPVRQRIFCRPRSLKVQFRSCHVQYNKTPLRVMWLPEGQLQKYAAGWGVNSGNSVADHWQSVTPWSSVASCSATASHARFRSTLAHRAITITLSALPSVAGRLLRRHRL